MKDFYIFDKNTKTIKSLPMDVFRNTAIGDNSIFVDEFKLKNGITITVSTIFLTFEHGTRNGKPLLFETMIFGGRYDEHEYQTRCCTYKECIKQHEVAKFAALPLKAKLKQL